MGKNRHISFFIFEASLLLGGLIFLGFLNCSEEMLSCTV